MSRCLFGIAAVAGAFALTAWATDAPHFPAIVLLLLISISGSVVVYLASVVRWAREATKDAKRQLGSANQRLRESETKYRELFGSIDQGFCVIEVMFDDREHA